MEDNLGNTVFITNLVRRFPGQLTYESFCAIIRLEYSVNNMNLATLYSHYCNKYKEIHG